MTPKTFTCQCSASEIFVYETMVWSGNLNTNGPSLQGFGPYFLWCFYPNPPGQGSCQKNWPFYASAGLTRHIRRSNATLWRSRVVFSDSDGDAGAQTFSSSPAREKLLNVTAIVASSSTPPSTGCPSGRKRPLWQNPH